MLFSIVLSSVFVAEVCLMQVRALSAVCEMSTRRCTAFGGFARFGWLRHRRLCELCRRGRAHPVRHAGGQRLSQGIKCVVRLRAMLPMLRRGVAIFRPVESAPDAWCLCPYPIALCCVPRICHPGRKMRRRILCVSRRTHRCAPSRQHLCLASAGVHRCHRCSVQRPPARKCPVYIAPPPLWRRQMSMPSRRQHSIFTSLSRSWLRPTTTVGAMTHVKM